MGICILPFHPWDSLCCLSSTFYTHMYVGIWEAMCGLVDSFPNAFIALSFRKHINNYTTKDIFFIICSCSHSHWTWTTP